MPNVGLDLVPEIKTCMVWLNQPGVPVLFLRFHIEVKNMVSIFVWFISLSAILFKYIHVVPSGKMSLFMAE